MSAETQDVEAAMRAGIDVSLIDASLRLTHQQRAMQHQSALNLLLEFERAGKALRDSKRPQSAAQSPA